MYIYIAILIISYILLAAFLREEHKKSEEKQAQLMVQLEKLNAQLATIKGDVKELKNDVKFLG